MVPCPWFDLWPWPLTSVLEDLFVLFTHPLLLQISGCVQNLFQLGPLWLHVLQNILFKKKVNNCTFVCFFLSMTIKKIFSKRWTQSSVSIKKIKHQNKSLKALLCKLVWWWYSFGIQRHFIVIFVPHNIWFNANITFKKNSDCLWC